MALWYYYVCSFQFIKAWICPVLAGLDSNPVQIVQPSALTSFISMDQLASVMMLRSYPIIISWCEWQMGGEKCLVFCTMKTFWGHSLYPEWNFQTSSFFSEFKLLHSWTFCSHVHAPYEHTGEYWFASTLHSLCTRCKAMKTPNLCTSFWFHLHQGKSTWRG